MGVTFSVISTSPGNFEGQDEIIDLKMHCNLYNTAQVFIITSINVRGEPDIRIIC